MPLYGFTCAACSHAFEAIEPVGTATSTCPKCKADGVKQVSAAGGYKMLGDNSSSRTPRGAGSFRKGRK